MKILVCDEKKAAHRQKDLLLKLAEKHRIEAEAEVLTSGKQLLFYAKGSEEEIDVIYLDYHLPDCSGMDVARLLRTSGVTADIVFYTMDETHAIEGYDVDALHYLIKGKDSIEKHEAVFLKAVSRAKNRKEETLYLYCAGERRKVDIGTIIYFEIDKRIITVHYGDGEQFRFYSTMSRLEEELQGKGFLRIHQAYLVAEKFIREKTKKTAVLSDQSILPVGRSFQGKVW